VKRLSHRNERGQVAVFLVVFLTGMLGLAAAVIDVGSWYYAKRAAQAAADAAALAAAQALPQSTAEASALAVDYVEVNLGGRDGIDVDFSTSSTANDTVQVRITRPAPAFFSRVFGIDSVEVGARGKAVAMSPSRARWAAPFAVNESHPLLSGSGCPCFDTPTSLDLKKTGPGGFRIVNLDGSRGGTSPSILAGWITEGFDGYMPLGWYYSDPGAKFNSSHVQNALNARIGDELLFPVYRSVRGGGANMEYEIVGWVGFRLTGFDARGSSGELYGSFTQVVWDGVWNEHSSGTDYGVRSISLID
jgi:hypothetical protein